MEQRIDMWQMRFEDALSLLHFNPATQKIQTLQGYAKELEKELKELKLQLESAQEAIKKREDEVMERSERIMQLQAQVKDYKAKHEEAEKRLAEIFEDFNTRSMVMIDAQSQCQKLKDTMENFDTEREALEDRIEQVTREKTRLTSQLNKTKANASVQAQPKTKTNSQQTDLSYQYLESVDGMQRGPRRNELLNKMKNAGDFVDDVEHGRDFTVKTRPSRANTADLRIEPTWDRKASLVHTTHSDDHKPRPPSLGKPYSSQTARQSTTAGTGRPGTRGSPGFGPSPGQGGVSAPRDNPIGLTPSPWPPNTPR
jgi:peptidoglycan hydrolase CwlO-like protein